MTVEVDPLHAMVGEIRAGHAGFSEDEWRARLARFLAAQNAASVISELRRPAGGASSASLIFKARALDKADAPEQPYVARLAPATPFFAHYDLVRQFEIQRHLHAAGLPVPDAHWVDADGTWLGRPGYIMDYCEGEASTAAYFGAGPLSGLDDRQRFARLRRMTESIAVFHERADAAQVPSLAASAQAVRPIEDEIDHWFALIGHARPELVECYEPIRRWLYEHAPPCAAPVLVHGDYQGSNVLWRGDELVAILDFEATRIGARESDLAWHQGLDEVSASFFSGLDIRLPSLRERAAWYEEACGVRLEHLDYHAIKAAFQMACGVVSFARFESRELRSEPTAYMDAYNRRLLKLLPEPFDLPLLKS